MRERIEQERRTFSKVFSIVTLYSIVNETRAVTFEKVCAGSVINAMSVLLMCC
jgi:hypothetical protein